MNTNKRNDAVKQNKEIKNSEKTATFNALKAAENNKTTAKANQS
jgi:hypothetical protein